MRRWRFVVVVVAGFIFVIGGVLSAGIASVVKMGFGAVLLALALTLDEIERWRPL